MIKSVVGDGYRQVAVGIALRRRRYFFSFSVVCSRKRPPGYLKNLSLREFSCYDIEI